MEDTIERPPEGVTVSELQRRLPETEINLLMAIGHRRDVDRWTIGDLLAEKIEIWMWPVRQASRLYANLTNYRDDRRVREFYYCSKFYSSSREGQSLRDEFSGRLSWDIMNFARKRALGDVRHVLEDAANEGYTIDELSLMYAEHEEDPEPEKGGGYPRVFRPLFRWMRNRVKPEHWQEAENLIDSFVSHMRELAE